MADDFGYVHVFWSEEVGGESTLDIPAGLIHDGNTIFYTRWDGASWTPPIDILIVPGEDIGDYVALTVDSDNQLHAVWTGQSNFYYSSAPSWQADSAHSWSDPVVVGTDSARSNWESDIVADTSGNVHIVYATRGEEPGIYHVRSQDGGTTWGAATKLSEPFDRLEVIFSNVRVVVDGAGSLHAVWQTRQKDGYGQGIYYARSIDGGISWSVPTRMAHRDPDGFHTGWPNLAAIGEGELHLVYVDGSTSIGRWHRISKDGGETWSDPYHFLVNFEGMNGYGVPLVDGAGRLHFVITMRTLTQIGGTIYTRWLGTEWTPAGFAVRESQETGPGAHWTAATVRLGNEIHVLWNTNFSNKAGEIWHTRSIIPGVAEAPLLPIPTAEIPPPTPVTASVTPDPIALPATPTAMPKPESPKLQEPAPPPRSEAFPLVVGVVPVLLLLAVAITWTRVRPQ